MPIVNEIFTSIQGESTFAGLPCVFVRIAGCPLKCRWCDTAYASSTEHGDAMTNAEVVDTVRLQGVKLVEITGGEPLCDRDVPELLTQFCNKGYTVLLETSGALDISVVDNRVHVVMDFKCPSSGMTDRMNWKNLDSLKKTDELKFVLASREDFEFARDVVVDKQLSESCTVLFSTVLGKLAPKDIVKWILEDKLNVRFQLQLHKYIWSPNTRGV